jgi:hypothetical protein
MVNYINEVFAPARQISDILKPIRGRNDPKAAAGYHGALHESHMMLTKGLSQVKEDVNNIPEDVLVELKALADIDRQCREKCISYGDLCQFLANSDLEGPARRGWIASKPKRPDPYPWANDPRVADDGETNALSKKNAKPKQPEFSRWAIASGNGKEWWLFHYRNSQWQQSGRLASLSNSKVAGKVARKLADSGGNVSKSEFIGCMKEDYPGNTKDAIINVVERHLSAIRKEIRESIGNFGKFDRVEANPIPYDDKAKGWQAKIEIGFAIKSGDRLVFQTKEQLTARDEAERIGMKIPDP